MKGEAPAPAQINWDRLSKTIEGAGKTVLLAACTTGQTATDRAFSADGKTYYQGVFTYALGQVLRRLDPASAARLPYDEVFRQVTAVVKQELEEQQTPVLNGASAGKALFEGAAGASTTAPAAAPVAATTIVAPVTTAPTVAAPVAATSPHSAPGWVVPGVDERLLVRVERFADDGDARATRAVSDGQARAPFVRLTKPGAYADRIITGRAGNPQQAIVYSPSGAPLQTFSAGTSEALSGLLLGDLRRASVTRWLARLHNPAAGFRVKLSASVSAASRGYRPTLRASAGDCMLRLDEGAEHLSRVSQIFF